MAQIALPLVSPSFNPNSFKVHIGCIGNNLFNGHTFFAQRGAEMLFYPRILSSWSFASGPRAERSALTCPSGSDILSSKVLAVQKTTRFFVYCSESKKSFPTLVQHLSKWITQYSHAFL